MLQTTKYGALTSFVQQAATVKRLQNCMFVPNAASDLFVTENLWKTTDGFLHLNNCSFSRNNKLTSKKSFVIFFSVGLHCISIQNAGKKSKKGRRLTKKIQSRANAQLNAQKPKLITLKNAVVATQNLRALLLLLYDLFHDTVLRYGKFLPYLIWATKLSIRSPQQILYPDSSIP